MTKQHVVVGNGAASIAMVLRLAADGHDRIRWFGGKSILNEIHGESSFGRPYGIAYRTTNPNHRLNAPAAAMDIGLPGELISFSQFLVKRKIADSELQAASMYALRSDYRQYLRHCLSLAMRSELFERMQAVVWDGEATFSDIDGLQAHDNLILCVGASHKRAPLWYNRFNPVQDPWDFDYQRVAHAKNIIVLGTGLTALDTARSIWDVNPEVMIKFVSRNGRFPLMHREGVKPVNLREHHMETMSLASMVGFIRYMSNLNDWQAVMNGLRQEWKNLWPVLSVRDKHRFLRIQPFWEIHRHRMIPEAAAMLEDHDYDVIKQVKLTAEQCHDADFIFNATGVDTDPRGNELLSRMIKMRMISADPSFPRLGLQSDKSCKVGHGIWCVGAHMRATRWEATAMSDIVDMVNIVAQQQ